jgi:hypothetical protein
MATGAAIASSNEAAATANAYSAGAAAATYAQPSTIYGALPPGAVSVNKGGTTYYISGNTWYLPSYGANGVYYQVVPTPY